MVTKRMTTTTWMKTLRMKMCIRDRPYYTVTRGMKYGLSVYDHIVLDASLVHEGQILYQ